MGVARRLAGWAGALALATLAVTMAAVVFFSARNLELRGAARGLADPVDAIIVLGGSIDNDGVIGYSSRRRVKAAVSLLAKEKARRLILSGGALEGSAPLMISELMRDYAIRLGAPPEALVVENRSVSTFENLRFSFALAEAEGLERLAVLTDAYHLERARWLAAYFGRPDIVALAVPGLHAEGIANSTLSTVREALAWWYNLAKVAGWEVLELAGVDPERRRQWVR